MTRGLFLLAVSVLFSGCAQPEIIVPDLMTLVALLPTHGSVGVSPAVEPLVYFSHTVADASDVENGFALECLGTTSSDSCAEPDSGTCAAKEIAATVSYDGTNQIGRLVPDAPLASGTCYSLVVSAGIAAVDSNVGPLPVTVRSAFKTR